MRLAPIVIAVAASLSLAGAAAPGARAALHHRLAPISIASALPSARHRLSGTDMTIQLPALRHVTWIGATVSVTDGASR